MSTVTRVFPTSSQASAPKDDIATYNARDLVNNGVQAQIVLDGQVYTLRITKSEKLILTK